jgi:hypothetical protein
LCLKKCLFIPELASPQIRISFSMTGYIRGQTRRRVRMAVCILQERARGPRTAPETNLILLSPN